MTDCFMGSVLADATGGYVSIVKVAVMAVLLVPWLYGATWIAKDAARVHMPVWPWSAGALASGLGALLLAFLMPWFAVVLAVYLAAAGGVLGTYVVLRNKRVKSQARVLTVEHFQSIFKREKDKTVEVVQRIKLYDNLTRPVVPPKTEEQRLAYNLAQNFLFNVAIYRASEANLAPAGEQASVKFMVDGVAQPCPPVERADSEQVIDYVKGLAGLNVQDKRRPTGKISMEVGGTMLDVSVTTAGTTGGQRMQLRIVQESVKTDLEEIGLAKDTLKRLEELNQGSEGLILISGPPGSGVTSTMYSLLRRHDAFIRQLVALETTSKVDLENVTQQTYKDQTELAAKLASLLRREPDVVMVENCDVTGAARMICEAAAARNFLVGAAADNAFVGLARWVKTVGDARDAVAHLKAVTCQVLLRKLCPTCREAYAPPKEMLARLNLPADRIEHFYRPPTRPVVDNKGNPIICSTCRGTGYYGRTGAFELLEMTDDIRERVANNESLKDIKAACRKNKMLYLQEQALRKVIDGITSVEEVVRVSSKAR